MPPPRVYTKTPFTNQVVSRKAT